MAREPQAADYAPRVEWAEYLALDDPPGLRLELEEGRLLVSPSGRTAHNVLRDLLLMLLAAYEEEHPDRCFVVSEQSFFMPEGKRDFRPDVAVIVDARKDGPIDPVAWIHGAPDIAVEILSASTEERDLGLKARRYFEQGSDEYWVLDPVARTASFFARGERGWRDFPVDEAGVYRTALLPGLELSIPALWTRLDRKLRQSAPG
jgi:Uma2 family endonuclease